MNVFDILVENHLKKIKASKSRWLEFGEYDLTAISLSTNSTVMALLTDTTTNVQSMRDIVKSVSKGISDRRIATSARNTVYDNFYAALVDLESVVKKTFKANPDVYNKEFFQFNLGEYGNASVKDQSTLTDRLKALTTKYVTELGIPTQTLFAGFDADYTTAVDTQRTAAQIVVNNSADYKKVLDAFLDQMWINMNVINGAYARQPGVAKGYFKQSVLHPRHKNRGGIVIDKPLKVSLKPQSIELADFSYASTDKILLDVTGKCSIFYFTRDAEITNIIVPDDAVEVGEGEELVLLGSALKKCFYVANKEITLTAKLELSLM